MRRFIQTAVVGMLAAMLAGIPNAVQAQQTAPPGGTYKAVSTLVPLPDFIPGLGQLYVDPATLPAGPFLAYDHQGKLVSSIYMIPLKDLNAKKAFTNLTIANERADHVDFVFMPATPAWPSRTTTSSSGTCQWNAPINW